MSSESPRQGRRRSLSEPPQFSESLFEVDRKSKKGNPMSKLFHKFNLPWRHHSHDEKDLEHGNCPLPEEDKCELYEEEEIEEEEMCVESTEEPVKSKGDSNLINSENDSLLLNVNSSEDSDLDENAKGEVKQSPSKMRQNQCSLVKIDEDETLNDNQVEKTKKNNDTEGKENEKGDGEANEDESDEAKLSEGEEEDGNKKEEVPLHEPPPSPLPPPAKSILKPPSSAGNRHYLRRRSMSLPESEMNTKLNLRKLQVHFSPDTVDPPPRPCRYREWIEQRTGYIHRPRSVVRHEKQKQKLQQLHKINLNDYLSKSSNSHYSRSIFSSPLPAFTGDMYL